MLHIELYKALEQALLRTCTHILVDIRLHYLFKFKRIGYWGYVKSTKVNTYLKIHSLFFYITLEKEHVCLCQTNVGRLSSEQPNFIVKWETDCFRIRGRLYEPTHLPFHMKRKLHPLQTAFIEHFYCVAFITS